MKYGLTKTATKWHIAIGSFAKCGIHLKETIELPKKLQPKEGDVCLSCRGVRWKGVW